MPSLHLQHTEATQHPPLQGYQYEKWRLPEFLFQKPRVPP